MPDSKPNAQGLAPREVRAWRARRNDNDDHPGIFRIIAGKCRETFRRTPRVNPPEIQSVNSSLFVQKLGAVFSAVSSAVDRRKGFHLD